MNIAVVGIGGVGGYIAGLLGSAYDDLTVVARGKRKEVLKEKGLVLHSEYNGEICVHPNVVSSDELTKQDVIFICVKNYSLESACEEIKHAIGKDTIVVPIMNGVDPGCRIRKMLDGVGTVVDSLIYIVAFANEDDSITQQGAFADVRIGIPNATKEEKEKVNVVSQIFKKANIDHAVADDIEVEIWRKYILNCAYNVTTAYYNETIGQIRGDDRKAREYVTLVLEAYEVAKSKHVAVTPSHIAAIIHRFYKELADNATSSLQRDIWSNKTAEVEVFSGYIVKEAKKANLFVPVSEKMYEGLRKHQS